MLFITALTLLLPCAFASVLPRNSHIQPRQATSGAFTLIAAHSGSPIHLQSINANEGSFWIGKNTSSYCPVPPVPVGDCPAGTITALECGNGRCSMYSAVPGGQDVYISPTGALSFTEPHAEGGETGTTTGFSYVNSTVSSIGQFGFSGNGSTGWIACPATSGGSPYQVFANIPALGDQDVPGGNIGACIGFDALGSTYEGNGVPAFEYE